VLTLVKRLVSSGAALAFVAARVGGGGSGDVALAF